MTKTHNNTKALTANIKGRILQGRGAKYYIGNITSVVFFDDMWPSGMHVTWPFVMPSRGLCRQSSYARMLDFDPTQLCSMWTRADISGKLCRNKFMSDHCSGIAIWTQPNRAYQVRVIYCPCECSYWQKQLAMCEWLSCLDCQRR